MSRLISCVIVTRGVTTKHCTANFPSRSLNLIHRKQIQWCIELIYHDDVIKWKQFPRCWPFVRRIHRSPVNSPHKGQWRRTLMFSLICHWINGWVNNREAGDLRRHQAHYDVIVMFFTIYVVAASNMFYCTFRLFGIILFFTHHTSHELC